MVFLFLCKGAFWKDSPMQQDTLQRSGHAMRRKLKLGPSDVFLQKAPISFDASVQELFNSLACGGVLLLAAPGGEKDTQYLARLCKQQRVTCASFVPSQLDVLLQARFLSTAAATVRLCCAPT